MFKLLLAFNSLFRNMDTINRLSVMVLKADYQGWTVFDAGSIKENN